MPTRSRSWPTPTVSVGVQDRPRRERDESADHADAVYHFDQVGWLDDDGVAAGSGEDFLRPCTPDPR
jgi:hypothetical protein